MDSVPRALIVGCGYLGRRVGALLLKDGWRVTATTTTSARFEELSALALEPELLDLGRPADSLVWNGRFEAVVVAVAPGRGGDARLAFHDGPIECARRIAESGGGALRRFVFVSSTGVYSEQRGGWVDEDSPAEPREERLKWLRGAEDHLRDLAVSRGFPAVVLRLAGIYGPDRSPAEWLRRPEMLTRISQARGDAFMNWVRVEDAARAALLATHAGRSGEVYIVTDEEPVRRRDFYGFAARLEGLELPAFAESGDLGKRCSGRKAREELGFEPAFRTYREGLADLAGPAKPPA